MSEKTEEIILALVVFHQEAKFAAGQAGFGRAMAKDASLHESRMMVVHLKR